MKIVSQNLLKEIEFLSALARLYEQNGNASEREATIAAIAALKHLFDVINHPNNDSPRSMPLAA